MYIEFLSTYVDDTFALFNIEQDALSFYSFIHTRHPNIKFTIMIKREENHKLPFLDVLFDNHNNIISGPFLQSPGIFLGP